MIQKAWLYGHAFFAHRKLYHGSILPAKADFHGYFFVLQNIGKEKGDKCHEHY